MITVERKAFVKALELGGMFAERCSTIPALAGVKVVANGSLRIESNDLDMTVQAEVDYAGEAGEWLLPDPRRLRAGLAAAGGESVALAKTLGGERSGPTARITAGALDFRLNVLPAADHSGADQVVEELWGCEVGAEALRAIARVFPAISTEETRYYLNGVCVEQIGEWLFRFVATDGHRLFISDVAIPGFTGELPPRTIIPRAAIRAACDMLGARGKEPVRLRYGRGPTRNAPSPDLADTPGGLRFAFAGKSGDVRLTLVTKLIDGTYPDYTLVIPSELPVLIRASRSALIQAVSSLSAFASEKIRAVKLAVEPGQLRLSLNSPMLGEGSFAIAAEHNAPPGWHTGMNGKYLIELCAAFSGEEIEFHASDPSGPIMVKDPADTAFFAVQMPMRA